MAVFPCTLVDHRYPGPQRSAYITLNEGVSMQTRKHRLCKRHFDQFCEAVASRLAYVDGESQSSMVCEGCGSGRTTSCYVTLYDQGEEPAAWAGDFCAACASRVASELFWTRTVGR